MSCRSRADHLSASSFRSLRNRSRPGSRWCRCQRTTSRPSAPEPSSSGRTCRSPRCSRSWRERRVRKSSSRPSEINLLPVPPTVPLKCFPQTLLTSSDVYLLSSSLNLTSVEVFFIFILTFIQLVFPLNSLQKVKFLSHKFVFFT